jgi:hypothetical protein
MRTHHTHYLGDSLSWRRVSSVGRYLVRPCDSSNPAQCWTLTQCVDGIAYESTPPTATTNRVCTTCERCTGNTWAGFRRVRCSTPLAHWLLDIAPARLSDTITSLLLGAS